MIILFLDIDGVLLSHRNIDSRISDYLNKKYMASGLQKSKSYDRSKARDKAAVNLFDPIAIHHLNQLMNSIEKNGIQVGIVISSSWRENRSIKQLKKLFKKYLFSTNIIDKIADRIYLVDTDIDFQHHLDRGEEIDVWIQLNRKKWNIENFLILDDVDSSMTRLFESNFVKCNNNFGEDELKRALLLLRKDIQDDRNSKDDPLLNKVSVKIYRNENRKKKEMSEKLSIRISLDARSHFLTLFSQNRLLLPEKCSNLIIEYDDSRERKEPNTNCLIM